MADADALGERLQKALQGQYRILRLLGRGGMGAVYLAREEALERLVAIKVLAGALDADARERFRREARNGARLTHAGIVPLYSFGEADGFPYLVMGYVRGETLSDAAAARGPHGGRRRAARAGRRGGGARPRPPPRHRPPRREARQHHDRRRVGPGAADRLRRGQGLGRRADHDRRPAGVVGTPQYMSPEQVAGAADVDGRSDIYALGLTAYLMLSGHLPFEGGTPQDVLLRRLSQDPRPLRQAASDVPEDLAAAVMRCLAREPPARWPDARAFRDAAAPVNLDEDELPEPLEGIDGRGAFTLPFLLLGAFGLWGLWCHSGSMEHGRAWWFEIPTDRASGVFFIVGLAVTTFQIPTLLNAFRLARRRGFTAGQFATAVMRQPRWWLCFWYPRRLRRAGDVWDRLPRPFRTWRVLATVLALTLIPWVALTMYVQGPRVAQAHPYVQQTLAAELTACWILVGVAALAAGISQIPCARMLRSRGYDTYTLRRVAHALLIGPTSDRALWKRPELSRLLHARPAARAAATADRLRVPERDLAGGRAAGRRAARAGPGGGGARTEAARGSERARPRGGATGPGGGSRPRSLASRRASCARRASRARARTNGRCSGCCRTSATCSFACGSATTKRGPAATRSCRRCASCGPA